MKFKKIVIGSLSLASVITPVSMVISCGNSDSGLYKSLKAYSKNIQSIDFKQKNATFDINDITELNKYDATMTHWIDGDTPTVTFDNAIKGKKKWNIRIAAIDTPELHLPGTGQETKGEEFKWADKARAFGAKEMPKGTRIKILTVAASSYNRIVGSIFYKKPNETKYKSYSVEVLRKGLATPFFNDKVANVGTTGSLMNVTGIALADAYNSALQNLSGIFSVDTGKILGIHGTTADQAIRYRIGKRDPLFESKNIYEIAGVSYK